MSLGYGWVQYEIRLLLTEMTRPDRPELWWKPDDLFHAYDTGLFPSSVRRAVHSLEAAGVVEIGYAVVRTRVGLRRCLVTRLALNDGQREEERALLAKLRQLTEDEERQFYGRCEAQLSRYSDFFLPHWVTSRRLD